ncbi:hypothetical protein [Pseudoneobacillus sp. C159]
MNREKLHIPMPDNETIQKEIQTIIRLGVKPKESFLSVLLRLYKEVGFHYLFTNPRDGVFITMSIMAVLIYLLTMIAEPYQFNEANIYGFVFISSPLLFIALSLYDLLEKRQRATIEVEMTAKHNLYQVAAFRMLHFSIITILVNTICMLSLVWRYDTFDFFRTFMISTTALFLFSVLFLFVFVKRKSVGVALMVGVSWVGCNIAFSIINHQVYTDFLMTMPMVVYGMVLLSSMVVFYHYLSKLIQMKPIGGVL